MQKTTITPVIPAVKPPCARINVPPAFPIVKDITKLPVITPLTPGRPATVTIPQVPLPLVKTKVEEGKHLVPEGRTAAQYVQPFQQLTPPNTGFGILPMAGKKLTLNVIPKPVTGIIPVVTIPTITTPKPIAVPAVKVAPEPPKPNPIPVPDQQKVRELVLRPWQVEWAEKARNILLRNHGYIDTSRMRSGKTYVLLWLAKQFNFRLLIICPVIVMEVWKRTAAEYGVEVIDIISYQSLRSQKGHQPKHGYLDRFDNVTDGGKHQVSFAPTKSYLDLVDQGVMVVGDEIQNIKNNSSQYKAFNALIRPIISTGGSSRFGLLSGTPFDKEEHAVNLLRLIGYIRSYRLYYYIRETKELVLEGLQELIDACRFINAQETQRVLDEIPLLRGKMTHLCYTLYVRVIKTYLSGSMVAPANTEAQFDVKNGFYNITTNRAIQLQNAIDELARATHFNERTGTVEMGADNIGAVTTALVHVENAKVDDLSRVATDILMADQRNKVVISVNYTSTIEDLKMLLTYFNPIILNGKIPAKKRADLIRQFNENPTRRLFIMNTAVGGVGISLNTQGAAPHYMLMSPSYKLLEVTQAASRIWNDDTMFDATVRMFYGKGAAVNETGILNAMARKTQVLKGTLEGVNLATLVLPGDYEAIQEADR